ncbi:hypothetical protein TSAR_003622 [Trichomalopsis sarcophagae]|uniref:Spaetzle domain-containing protein n=1 Tax=Trichomalopsis sarcophagae TaxID=543379 RepID=A0A232EM95_9HYME|nr:hypothetical protein TSAR_003622 [Trichomalopsis sarcophagae]
MCSTNYVFISILLSFVITTKAVLNRDDENFFGETVDRYDWSKHRCHRNCILMMKNQRSAMEQFSAMSKACYECPFNPADCYRRQTPLFTSRRDAKNYLYGQPTNSRPNNRGIFCCFVCVDDVIVEEV